MRTPASQHLSRIIQATLACLVLLMATAPVLSAQSAPTAPTQHDYHFEVASIRPAGPPTGLEYKSGPQGYSPGLFRETNASLAGLAFTAFKIRQNFQIKYPSWMDSAYFTITATLPQGAAKADVPIMLQHLLEDRFALLSHHETRQMPGYELVVARPSPGLTKAAPPPDKSAPPPDAAAAKTGLPNNIEMKNGVPQFSKESGSGQLYTRGTAIWRGRGKTMASLVDDLARTLGTPVADATSLEGKYDYDITFTPEATTGSGVVVSPLPSGGTPNPAASDEVPLEHPLLREALLEQLGLKLQPVKNVPVDVVVLDSANKDPTEN